MHGLVDAQTVGIGPVERRQIGTQAAHLLRSRHGCEAHEFRFAGGFDQGGKLAEFKADPRHHHGPGFDTAEAVDPFFQWQAHQLFQIDAARLHDLAGHLHRPRPHRQALGLAGGG